MFTAIKAPGSLNGFRIPVSKPEFKPNSTSHCLSFKNQSRIFPNVYKALVKYNGAGDITSSFAVQRPLDWPTSRVAANEWLWEAA